MPEQFRNLVLFLASPSDVDKERKIAREVVTEVNDALGTHIRVKFEVKEWSDVPPEVGNPENNILNAIPVHTWDIFVGILWSRFGMDPGKVELARGKRFKSGTKAEFDLAYERWQKEASPRLLLYRCTKSLPTSLDTEQYRRVQEFFRDFEPKGKHPGLVSHFKHGEEFRKMLTKHLIDVLMQMVKWWSQNDPLITEIMRKLALIYRKQNLKPYPHHRAAFEVVAHRWEDPGKPCTIRWRLEFSPSKEPLYALELSLILRATDGLLTTPEIIVTDAKGAKLQIEQLAALDSTNRRSLLVYFLPPLQPGSGPFTLQFAETGPLKEQDLNDLVYTSEKHLGKFDSIELVLHFPQKVRVRLKRLKGTPRGRLMKPKELEAHSSAGDFAKIGWTAKNVNLKIKQRFGVEIIKLQGRGSRGRRAAPGNS